MFVSVEVYRLDRGASVGDVFGPDRRWTDQAGLSRRSRSSIAASIFFRSSGIWSVSDAKSAPNIASTVAGDVVVTVAGAQKQPKTWKL